MVETVMPEIQKQLKQLLHWFVNVIRPPLGKHSLWFPGLNTVEQHLSNIFFSTAKSFSNGFPGTTQDVKTDGRRAPLVEAQGFSSSLAPPRDFGGMQFKHDIQLKIHLGWLLTLEC